MLLDPAITTSLRELRPFPFPFPPALLTLSLIILDVLEASDLESSGRGRDLGGGILNAKLQITLAMLEWRMVGRECNHRIVVFDRGREVVDLSGRVRSASPIACHSYGADPCRLRT